MMLVLIMMAVVGAGVSASDAGKPEENDVYKPLQCGPNSHYERCSKICPPQNCSSLIDPYWLCENPRCKPECRCNDGYVRDDRTGICISRDECLAQCGPLERFVKDSTECQRTCANYKVTGPRSLCKPFTGCICEEGRLRLNDNATGACVLPKDCPRRQCPLHEHWEDCPSVCAKETCISKNPDYICLLPAIPLPCKPRCICNKGYLRNHLGHCIPENNCPIKRCPINEVWRCASMCPWDSCKRLESGFKCPPGIISVCIPACACKDGYMRNDRGLCIPKKLCPASVLCGINEVAVECQATIPQTCESVYTLYRPIENPPCVPGCDCRPGYLRNKRNICVPSEFCPTVPPNECGVNQEYKKCGTSCEPSCAGLDNPPQACPAVCVKGCFCKDGYLKDGHGNCVPRSQCPLPVCNKPNEEAKECGSYCEIRTCEDYNRTDIVCPAVCVRGCFCRKGYVKNAYGICIRPEKCPPKPVCLQEHEEYQSCGSSCPDNCDNYVKPDRICTKNCVAGCNCKKGYVRNLKDNTCVKPEQCPVKECTGVNEKLNYCASYCPVTCANRYTQGDWACITLCREACDCIPGTLRNDSGACVPVEQCTPPVCRQNEKYMKCGTACPLTCDNYKKPPPCTQQCVEDCFCEDGYVRDRYMRCVKPENCEPICPAGEKFNECSAHCQDTCENYNVTNRICTYQCQSGCVCEEGTVRRKDGQCVPPSKCTDTIICPSDETYDPCSAHCEPTCENHGPGRVCTAICKPGCKCGDGLVRRKDGKCVKLEECPGSQCPDNEVYDPCPPINCPPGKACAQVCRPTCRCADGLVRCKDGRCAKPEKCETKPQCPVNERWVGCVLGVCIPLACDQLGFPIACPGIIGPCKGGCVCAENYVRDNNSICIPKQDCPSCGNDFNATSGCGIHCGRQCTDYKDQPHCNIPLPCQYNGCDCKQGYVYDIVAERCVASVDCPTPCNGDLYAEEVKCPNPCPATCANPTTAICPRACLTKGCQCRPGFVLNPDGKCIRPESCPDNLGCNGDTNAQISSCVSLCEPTCGLSPTFCPAYCGLGCACKTGFILSKPNGVCIKPEKCANNTACDDPNAERVECAPAPSCRSTCATPNPSPCKQSCAVNECVCKNGYVLSAKGGKCIPVNECPKDVPCNGDSNAIIKANPIPCPSTCSAPNANPRCKRYAPPVGCECKPGYIQVTDGGKCIKLEECSGGNPCGANSTFEWCKAECPTDYCPVDDSRAFIACDLPYPCPNGCVCKLNYRRKSVDDDRCILAPTCPPVKCTRPNEIWDPCPSECRRERCEDVNNQPTTCNTLVLNCQPQCICKKGYFRNDTDICIPGKDCQNNKPCDDLNAERLECAPAPSCRLTCARPNPSPCILSCAVNECVCKKGYILSAKDGPCIPVNECPKDAPCNGDINAVIKTNPIPCPSTCSAPNASPYCERYSPPIGCECRPGFLRADDGGKCIKPDECPGGNPCGQNGTFVGCAYDCPSNYCPEVDSGTAVACIPPPGLCPSGCACKINYKRQSKSDNKCILASDCPKNKPCSDPNAERVECAPAPSCRSTCVTPNPSPCILSCAVNECVCKKGYILSAKGGKCIPVNECPKDVPCNGDSNAVIKANPIPCPSTCSAPNASPWCKRYAPPVGCECKPGYLQAEDGGKCIKPEECPGGNPCGANSTFVWCKAGCPTDYCPVDDRRAIIACSPPYPCPNGCVCKLNYRKKSVSDDRCILASTCPAVKCTRPNEIWDPCPSDCRRERCADVNNQPTTCNTLVLNCQPQCICKKGYFRNDTDICIPAKDCPNNQHCDDPNAERVECAPAPSCRSTCTSPNPSPCILSCVVNECVCKKGYVLSAKDGKCIPVDQCPKDVPCNGDSNAVIKVSPIPCPSTCSAPNANPWCKRSAPPVGCECKPGYLQVKDDGKCIKPEECPGGNPCGANSTFAWCKAGCPTDYCPVDDSRAIIACDPPYPCPNGCLCKLNYRRKSVDDDRCILAPTCPPVKCTRPNEIWDPCPSECRRESCEDVNNQPTTCNTLVLNCQPQCICKKGFFRNDKDICIPAKDCPNKQRCEDPNAERVECAPAPSCRSTCTSPNPSPCILSCVVNDCVCKKGYVLSAKDGKCIPVDQCPKDVPCNGDSNAVIKVSPIPCPSTCSAPNANPWCKRSVPPVGCECKPGYLLADDGGKCIKPDTCPGGNPCGQNGTFVSCSVNCPSNNCPVGDNRGIVACSPPNPCPSGCACKKNYKRKSTANNTFECILASDCPNNKTCKDPNAERVQCAPATQCRPTCAVRNPGPCIEICVLDDCVCKKGYVLSENGGNCIPEDQCPPNNQCIDPNAERVECALATECRPTCAKPNPGPCYSQICIKNECVCKRGYVLSEKGGKCVSADQCSIQKTCNGDPNAQIKKCPLACPATCDAPNAIPCRKACLPVGCECKDGYILSETNGKCILPEKCKGGNPCGKNETYVSCKVPCPSDNCPVGNSPNRVICETPSPCYPGCVCRFNYRRKSIDDRRCIYASECPPQKCNKNEEWAGCPSECLQEDCSNVHDPPVVCNTLLLNCQPKCICKKGYYRDSKRNCVLASQCPKPIQCKANEVYRTCRIICPPQTCASIYTDYDCRVASTRCEPGCDCISEYLRNGTENDPCIPSSQCPTSPPVTPECGINEHYETNRNKCELTCKNYELGSVLGPCPTTSGCFCDTDYVRNSSGLCVPKKKCPKPTQCKANEVYRKCRIICPPQTCASTYTSYDCGVANTRCEPGCDCISEYLRNGTENDPCIPSSQCPTSPPVTPECGINEHYETNRKKCELTCKNYELESVLGPCPATSGCFCDTDYVRNSSGLCIPKKKCPKPTQCKANEVYRKCRIICPPQTCASTYTSYDCGVANTRCEPGCDCISEYLRNGTENDPCIPSSQCPTSPPVTPECGINEHYETNRNKCELTCKNYELESVMGPCPATSGCFCDTDYVRNTNGLCIPKKKCPKNIVCPPNEVLSECYNSCHTTCKTRLRSDGRMCQLACVDTGCLCKKGYLRHDNGTCVPISECSPPRCNENETYSSCGTACPLTCHNRGDNCTACTDQCVEDCFCNKGLVRDDDKTCVKPKDCPKRTCSGPNEVFDECPPTCPPTDGCSNIWSKFNCTAAIKCCKPQCRCRPGYFRSNSNCVPSSQC